MQHRKPQAWMHHPHGALESDATGVLRYESAGSRGEMLGGVWPATSYAINDGVLYTAPADVVLPGISRQIVLEISQPILPYVIKPPNITELELLQEAFITSASRGIVPVVEIDLFRLGNGTPGPLTRRLRAAYEEWVAAHLEEI